MTKEDAKIALSVYNRMTRGNLVAARNLKLTEARCAYQDDIQNNAAAVWQQGDTVAKRLMQPGVIT